MATSVDGVMPLLERQQILAKCPILHGRQLVVPSLISMQLLHDFICTARQSHAVPVTMTSVHNSTKTL